MLTRELDHMNYEVMRFYLVNPNGSINPVAMTVPRKVINITPQNI